MFRYFFLLLTLALSCDAARDGFYKVKNDGGYWTRFSVTFEYEGNSITYNTDKFGAGTSRILEVPKTATHTKFLVENEIWIGVWRPVIELEWDMPQSFCYNVWGSTLHPSWQVTPDHLCEANSEGSYSVTNKAGYVSRFKVNALINGTWSTFSSGDFSAGQTRTLYAPRGSTKNSFSIEHYVAAGHPRGFLELNWEAAQNVCFKIYGAIYKPTWEEVAC